jgi:hypothetical protein
MKEDRSREAASRTPKGPLVQIGRESWGDTTRGLRAMEVPGLGTLVLISTRIHTPGSTVLAESSVFVPGAGIESDGNGGHKLYREGGVGRAAEQGRLALIGAARMLHANENLEIDGDARVSGNWVQGWVWLPAEDCAGLDGGAVALLARERYASEDLSVDDAPASSESDDGTWVEAWVHVPSVQPRKERGNR